MATTHDPAGVFREACCLCGKQVAGQIITAGEAGIIAREDLTGYRCASCGLTYCQDCAIKHVFRIFGHSVCKACGASAKEADYIVDKPPPLLELSGYVEVVEASDYGGGSRDDPVLVALFADSLRITGKSSAGPDVSTKVDLAKLSEVYLLPPAGALGRGSLLLKLSNQGLLGRLLAGKKEIRFDPADQPAFEGLAARLRELTAGTISAAPEQAAPAEAPAAEPPDSSLDLLEKLADLREKGIITEEEFAAKKKQILGL